jgi:hypothetical protein
MAPATTTLTSHSAQNAVGYLKSGLVRAKLMTIDIAVSSTPVAVNNATADVGIFLMIGALRQAYVPLTAIREGMSYVQLNKKSRTDKSRQMARPSYSGSRPQGKSTGYPRNGRNWSGKPPNCGLLSGLILTTTGNGQPSQSLRNDNPIPQPVAA